jgi:hypothetical protein
LIQGALWKTLKQDTALADAKQTVKAKIKLLGHVLVRLAIIIQVVDRERAEAQAKVQKGEQILKWLAENSSWEAVQKTHTDRRAFANTGDWIVGAREVQAWINGTNQLLFCLGEGEVNSFRES